MTLRNLTVVVFFLSVSCASWQATHEPIGEIVSSDTQSHVIAAPEDVKIFVGEIPDGFDYRDGVLYVDTTEGNKILGPIGLKVKKPGLGVRRPLAILTLGVSYIGTDYPPDLTRDEVIRLFKEKCSAIGGNAVINATIPRSDFKGYGYFSGLAVILTQN